MVTGIQCLDYTSDYLRNESISRTEGNVNFKKFAFLPKYTPEVMRLAVTLARSTKVINIRPTKINKQFILSKSDEKLSDDVAISMINNSNSNTFSSWEEREKYSKKFMVISPILNDRLSSISKYSCTCRTYLNAYECEHSLGISIARNEISDTVSMNLPLGVKRKRGRPCNAVKGALNCQTKETKKEIRRDVFPRQSEESVSSFSDSHSKGRGNVYFSNRFYSILLRNLICCLFVLRRRIQRYWNRPKQRCNGF